MKKVISLALIFGVLFSFASCTVVPPYESGLGDKDTTPPLTESGDGAVTQSPDIECNPVTARTVSFRTNGGTAVASRTVNTLMQAPTTEREGHLFLGWYLDESLIEPAIFPLTPEYDTTLYAKWLTLKSAEYYNGCDLKWFFGSESKATYFITPNGFDMDTLVKEGYKMRITVSYDVSYIKDYDIWLNIGYAGSPKYEVYLRNSTGYEAAWEDLPTTTDTRSKSVSVTMNASDLVGEKLRLVFSTNNIQNIVSIDNIRVTYECYK